MVRPWSGLGYRGDMPTVCPGYSTSLPEVIEIARARAHWAKGQLEAFCGGEPPTNDLMMGIEILDGAIASVLDWRSIPKDQGGGGG